MKKVYIIAASLMFFLPAIGQEEEKDKAADTMRMNAGKVEFIIVDHGDEEEDEDFFMSEEDSLLNEKKKKRSEAHWAGIDFGFSMLMDQNFDNTFADYPYWKNDAARSQTWNVNFLEHKFNFGTPYVGLTTGLGFSFTSVAFKNNYVLSDTPDTLWAMIDTVNTYSKNKLKASYLTLPLLLEFNTNAKANKSFYFATGVIGGVRMTSKIKRKGEFDGKEFVQKEKGRYGLNSFKLDATVRLGYSDFGAFATYSLLPLFDDGKTTEIYPLTFGLSFNF